MSFYGYTEQPKDYSFISQMANIVAQTVQKLPEMKLQDEQLRNFKDDKATADNAWNTGREAALKQLTDAGVDNPEGIVARYYTLPNLKTQTPHEKMQRALDISMKIGDYIDKYKTDNQPKVDAAKMQGQVQNVNNASALAGAASAVAAVPTQGMTPEERTAKQADAAMAATKPAVATETQFNEIAGRYPKMGDDTRTQIRKGAGVQTADEQYQTKLRESTLAGQEADTALRQAQTDKAKWDANRPYTAGGRAASRRDELVVQEKALRDRLKDAEQVLSDAEKAHTTLITNAPMAEFGDNMKEHKEALAAAKKRQDGVLQDIKNLKGQIEHITNQFSSLKNYDDGKQGDQGPSEEGIQFANTIKQDIATRSGQGLVPVDSVKNDAANRPALMIKLDKFRIENQIPIPYQRLQEMVNTGDDIENIVTVMLMLKPVSTPTMR